MASRVELDKLLKKTSGYPKIYFQPPSTVAMSYPTIVYSKTGDYMRHSNNGVYRRVWRYSVTVIDRNPDTTVPDSVALIPMCKLERVYSVDNLYHFVFNLYF